jgi:hypothetical protein
MHGIIKITLCDWIMIAKLIKGVESLIFSVGVTLEENNSQQM